MRYIHPLIEIKRTIVYINIRVKYFYLIEISHNEMLMVHTHVEFDVNAAVTNDPVILNEKRYM